MLKNYLTIAIRNLMRYKAYSFINISGLAVGMAGLILMLLFIQNEFRYNTHHPNADRIYRVVIDFGNDKASGATSGALGPAVNTELPDIEIVTRFFKDFSEILYDDQSFGPHSITLIDSGFFQLFHVDFTHGDGQYIVMGVIKDDPQTSIYNTRILHATPPRNDHPLSHWNGWVTNVGARHGIDTYLLRPQKTDLKKLGQKLTAILHRHTDKAQFSYNLQPLNRIHLYSRADFNLSSYGDIQRVYLYSGITTFIVLTACINFINLATARALGRVREVRLRKVVGAPNPK